MELFNIMFIVSGCLENRPIFYGIIRYIVQTCFFEKGNKMSHSGKSARSTFQPNSTHCKRALDTPLLNNVAYWFILPDFFELPKRHFFYKITNYVSLSSATLEFLVPTSFLSVLIQPKL